MSVSKNTNFLDYLFGESRKKEAIETAKRIKFLIGESRENEAVDLLEQLVESADNRDLDNQFSVLKSRQSNEIIKNIQGIKEGDITDNNISFALNLFTDRVEKVVLEKIEQERIEQQRKRDQGLLLFFTLLALLLLIRKCNSDNSWPKWIWENPPCVDSTTIDSLQQSNAALAENYKQIQRQFDSLQRNHQSIAQDSIIELKASLKSVRSRLNVCRNSSSGGSATNEINQLEADITNLRTQLNNCRNQARPVTPPPSNSSSPLPLPTSPVVKIWCLQNTWNNSTTLQSIKSRLTQKGISCVHKRLQSPANKIKKIEYGFGNKRNRGFAFVVLETLGDQYGLVADADHTTTNELNLYFD